MNSQANAGSLLARVAARSCAWSERWFPDAFAFAVALLAVVALAALAIDVPATTVVRQFGGGFWSLIIFTMQMCFIIIGGFVTADSPAVARLSARLAALPTSGRGAVTMVAIASILLSLLHWGLSLIFSSLLVRALALRGDLRMDYRAAGAASFMGAGSVWAMGLSSSAAQLQANPASMTPAHLAITGVIPFTETIFTWQSVAITIPLAVVTAWVAWRTAPADVEARTAAQLGLLVEKRDHSLPRRTRPGEWLEYSPLLNIVLALLIASWLALEVAGTGLVGAIANLNNYNLIFLLAGLLLQWRPRRFLETVARSIPSVGPVLIQFPIYGGIAAIVTGATNGAGQTLADLLTHFFRQFASSDTYAVVVGAYSAFLGMFVPSAGGKWLIEAPYVMQVANDLHYPLGWAVQIYNAAETLTNLINPFWMLPVIGVLGLRSRDLIGYTFVQFLVHAPLVLLLLWALGYTLHYHPPVVPAGPGG